jgi:hypothetical protein
MAEPGAPRGPKDPIGRGSLYDEYMGKYFKAIAAGDPNAIAFLFLALGAAGKGGELLLEGIVN